MSPERYARVCGLFSEALSLGPSQRSSFLARACADDPSLVGEVEGMLANDAESSAEGFLEPPTDLGSMIPQPEPEDPLVGRRIGHYEVKKRIASGGMGSVYLAVRADEIKRRVAIKVVKRGMDTEEILRRFRNERQILAGLNHPNIAQLLDGGTTADGLPYFVMEYVEGTPIDAYCDRNKLTTRERLEVFRPVLAAVQYAHQRAVIHRDLSPSNILVTGDRVPKLVDFGIAKLLNPELAFPAIDPTRTEYRFMKPEYASPEQVRGEAVTTASDVYSLGVVLYRLLTGHPPYHLKGEGKRDIERAVCEAEPEVPSTVIGRPVEVRRPDGTTETLTADGVSRTRDGQPARLRRNLAGDVDKIVLMALKKEPDRRYRSAELFSEDIQRHLDGLPVRAVRDTFLYRTRKFVARNTGMVAAAVVVALSLLGGAAGAGWSLYTRAAAAAELLRGLGDGQKLVEDAAKGDPFEDSTLFRAGMAADVLARRDDVPEGLRPQVAELVEAVKSEKAAVERDRRLLADLLEVRGRREGPPRARSDNRCLVVQVEPSADELFAAAFRAWDATFDVRRAAHRGPGRAAEGALGNRADGGSRGAGRVGRRAAAAGEGGAAVGEVGRRVGGSTPRPGRGAARAARPDGGWQADATTSAGSPRTDERRDGAGAGGPGARAGAPTGRGRCRGGAGAARGAGGAAARSYAAQRAGPTAGGTATAALGRRRGVLQRRASTAAGAGRAAGPRAGKDRPRGARVRPLRKAVVGE